MRCFFLCFCVFVFLCFCVLRSWYLSKGMVRKLDFRAYSLDNAMSEAHKNTKTQKHKNTF